MRLTVASLALAVAAFATTARADWQYTTWAMSPAEVVAASGGAVKPITGRPGQRVFDADLKAEGSYVAAGFDFKAEFFFDAAERLRVVKLSVREPGRCPELVTQMRGLYGRPSESDKIPGFVLLVERWEDASRNSLVQVTDGGSDRIGPRCFVTYRPLTTTGAQGL